MKKVCVLFLTLFFLIGAGNALACDMELPEIFLPVPESYCGLGDYDKSITIYMPGGPTFHYLWDSSKVTFTPQISWRYNPSTRIIYFGLSGDMGIPPYLAYAPGFTYLTTVTNVPINQYGYYPSGSTWEEICSCVSSATSDVQLYNTETEEYCGYTSKLAVILNLTEGGGVADTGENGIIECGVGAETEICEADIPKSSQIELMAIANENYEFAYWEWNEGASSSTNNPETFEMTNNLEVTAVFAKTFRCAAGNFYQTSGTGGWCTEYVESETGISLSGNAWQWWQNAISAGYATGSEPDISAIIVLNNQTLEYGHVGIVTDFDETYIWIQDSNWSDPYDFQIRNHWVYRSRSDISGYIYCTPPN